MCIQSLFRVDALIYPRESHPAQVPRIPACSVKASRWCELERRLRHAPSTNTVPPRGFFVSKRGCLISGKHESIPRPSGGRTRVTFVPSAALKIFLTPCTCLHAHHIFQQPKSELLAPPDCFLRARILGSANKVRPWDKGCGATRGGIVPAPTLLPPSRCSEVLHL